LLGHKLLKMVLHYLYGVDCSKSANWRKSEQGDVRADQARGGWNISDVFITDHDNNNNNNNNSNNNNTDDVICASSTRWRDFTTSAPHSLFQRWPR